MPGGEGALLFRVATILVVSDDKGEESMSFWPDYHSALFVNRPQAIERIRRWVDDPDAKRVLVLVAPPGSGKSWLLQKMEEEWKPNRLTVWLDAPQFINQQEEQNPNRMLNQTAFDDWFKQIRQTAEQFCANLGPIGNLATLDAQVEALVNMLCNCALNAYPTLIVDAYDEITEAQASTISLRVLAKFISRPCTRLLIAVRSESLIQEDTLRRNQALFYLTEDALGEDFATQQFRQWFVQEHGSQSLPTNLNAWMAAYRHYSWRNPAINHFLFSKGLSLSSDAPAVFTSLTASGLKECIQEIVRRGGKYEPLSDEEFEILYRIATELEEEWSYLEAEALLSISFYTNKNIRRLLEMGLLLWRAGLFYRVEASIRELLLEIEIRNLTSAPEEDVP